MSAALGVVNFVGVIWLSSLMSDPQVLYRNAELVQSIGGFLRHCKFTRRCSSPFQFCETSESELRISK